MKLHKILILSLLLSFYNCRHDIPTVSPYDRYSEHYNMQKWLDENAPQECVCDRCDFVAPRNQDYNITAIKFNPQNKYEIGFLKQLNLGYIGINQQILHTYNLEQGFGKKIISLSSSPMTYDWNKENEFIVFLYDILIARIDKNNEIAAINNRSSYIRNMYDFHHNNAKNTFLVKERYRDDSYKIIIYNNDLQKIDSIDNSNVKNMYIYQFEGDLVCGYYLINKKTRFFIYNTVSKQEELYDDIISDNQQISDLFYNKNTRDIYWLVGDYIQQKYGKTNIDTKQRIVLKEDSGCNSMEFSPDFEKVIFSKEHYAYYKSPPIWCNPALVQHFTIANIDGSNERLLVIPQ